MVRTNRAFIVFALVLLPWACARSADDSADVHAIQDVLAAWDQAWTAGDADALASFYVQEEHCRSGAI